ncbi:DUF2523 family protein [Herbaspirillum sp. GCM10030257]|jgi:hypothetical protein|uniref:DUF2523 family protein n=1 Tax=Herbaspirillum sp. GCM10030257 TaxID=3273393 RepID=UPI00361A3C17
MGAFFSAILGKVVALATWFGKLFVAVFESLWHLVTDLIVWTFIGSLKLIQTILNGLPGTSDFQLFNPATYIAGMPAEITNMLALCRIGECFAILLAAILIKLTLQIIPFTRLGS